MTTIAMPADFAATQPAGEAPAQEDGFTGFFCDGVASVRHPLTLCIRANRLVLQTTASIRTLTPQEVLAVAARRSGVQFIRLRDGGSCELPASQALHRRLEQVGVSMVPEIALSTSLHGNWRMVAAALVFLVAMLAALYVWLIPAVAARAVAVVPDSFKTHIGSTLLRRLDQGMLRPSELSDAQQTAMEELFERMVKAVDEKRANQYTLFIRKADIGPNAFALPGNIVVVTDELVTLVNGDLAVMAGILAHELGHQQHQHGLRNFIQASTLVVLGSALIGDYSSVLAAAPATLAHMRYSRGFEVEADIYSKAVLCGMQIDPAATALFFEKLTTKKAGAGLAVPEYLMTHPASGARAAFFRSGC